MQLSINIANHYSGGPCLKHLAQACTCVGRYAADCPHGHTKHVSRAKIARRLIRLCKRPSFHRQLSRRVSTPRSVTPPRGTLSRRHARTIARKTAVMLVVPEKGSIRGSINVATSSSGDDSPARDWHSIINIPKAKVIEAGVCRVKSNRIAYREGGISKV